MKATVTRAQMPALLELAHAARAACMERIIELEHELAKAKQELADLPWWRVLFSPPKPLSLALNRFDGLPAQLRDRRRRIVALEIAIRMIEFALGTQASALELDPDELRLIGLYGLGGTPC